METDELVNHLPKYLIVDGKNKATYYCLLIYKDDWDYTFEHSYQVYYAKQTKSGFNTSKPLLKAIGRTLNQALNNMNTLLEDEQQGIIIGKKYFKNKKNAKGSGN